MSGACLEHHRQAIGADPWVHDGDEYRAFGPELLRLVEAVGAGENARIFVTQIGNEQILRDAVRDTFHGGDGPILRAEIGQQHQRRARRRGR